MKKLILFLLPLFALAQNPTNFPYGIKNAAGATNNTPTYIVTQETDGVHKKTPAAIIEKTANKTSTVTNYSETLYPNEKAVHDGLDMKLNISDLPTNLTLYPTNVASDVSEYVKMVTDIHDADYNTIAVDVSTPAITTTSQLVSRRISAPGVLIGQPGVFNITTFGNIRHLSGTGTATFYFEVYHRDSLGVETLICTSSISAPVIDGGYTEFTASALWDDGIFDATDRIVIKSYANRIAGGSDPVYQFQFGGATPVRTLLPVPFSVVDAGYEMKINKQNSLAVDGSGIKYATVDAINAALPKTYSKIVYVNDVSPLTATIFDLNNPPVTNDNALKLDTANLYIGTDASTWVYNSTTYVTKAVPDASNFYISGTTTDAGSDKTSTIYRAGSIQTGGLFNTSTGMFISKNGSDTVNLGGRLAFYNGSFTAANMFQLNASNGLDLWNYASGSFTKRMTFSSAGDLTANSFIKSGGTSSQFLMADGSVSAGGSGGDMILASAQTNIGVKTFLTGTLGLRNVANTFTSFFTNSNTASRTYTLQDRNGTLADLTDIASVNTNKMNVPTGGIVSYLPKFLTTTTMELSRLWDTGTYLGIGTIYSPTKDITLGNQADRTFGIEDSDNMTKGRDLTNEAGRAVNFVPNNNFNAVAGGGEQWGFCSTTNGDVFYSRANQIYKQTGGSGSFVSMGQTSRDYRGMCSVGADVYVVVFGGFIYKLTGGTGTLSAYESTNRNWTDIAYSSSGNLYATVTSSGDLYKQTALTGSFTAQGLTARNYGSVSVSPANNVYICGSDQLYKQTNETGSFTAVSGLNQAVSVCVSPTNSDVYVANYTGALRKQANETGSYNDISSLLGSAVFAWQAIDFSLNGNIYIGGTGATSFYVQINYAVGSPNLDGGIYKSGAGTGKGTGKSLWQVWTGQKTTSGTDMQVSTKRIEIDENGRSSFYGIINLKAYTVATLPSALVGDTAYVTDALTPTYLGILIGGGSVSCPVFYNGTNWVSH